MYSIYPFEGLVVLVPDDCSWKGLMALQLPRADFSSKIRDKLSKYI